MDLTEVKSTDAPKKRAPKKKKPEAVEVELTQDEFSRLMVGIGKEKKELPTCQKDKLAILGTAPTMPQAPFEDKDFEIWGVAQLQTYPAFKRADYLYEMHTEGYWRHQHILERLNKWTGPTVMQDQYKEIPNAIRFPLEKILPYRRYHTTSITYMLAWAYHSFATTGKPLHLALFGVHMEAREEYTEQRPCCEYWIGRMEGAGMDIFIAGGAILGSTGLYGYENYDPACLKLRERINGLQAGMQIRANEELEAKLKKHEQIGAVKEAEFWLRLAQTGELTKSTTSELAPAPKETT